MVDVLSLRELPPRPPTPPRTSNLQTASFKDDPQVLSALRPGQLPSPPDLSPQVSSSDGRSKKVNFSPMTSYIKPLDLSSVESTSQSPLRNVLPSNQCKPAKSILKSTHAPSSTPDGGCEPGSAPPEQQLPDMIESVMEQLAGDDRASRADAYMQLLGTLTAYRDTPDSTLLSDKIPLLSQYIRRDISQCPNASNPAEVSFVRQALSLLTMIVWRPDLSIHLTDDFKSFFFDHTVSSLQNPSLPKSIVVEYMRILSVQNFPSKVFITSRVVNLLSTLKDITERAGGKAVVALRLAIYEKLLAQARSTFASQANTWADNVVTALLHKVKDIRIKAIKLGLHIAVTFNPHVAISKAVQDVLDVPSEDGSPFVEELSNRLLNMISGSDSGIHVPQVWSTVILLLRRNRWSVDQWSRLKNWLLVVQKCFNCSDSAIRLQALIAWDRFVFAVHPNEVTNRETIKLLLRPIASQLEKKRGDKPSALGAQAFSSYYHLLYLTFRPSLSYDRLDLFWKDYIVRPMSHALAPAPRSHEIGCRILASLFWNPQPKPWDERLPIESSKLQPTDIPMLDFRWVRSRLSAIFPVFETMLRTATWSDAAPSESPVALAWTNLSKCLSEASSKEISPSPETMQAVTCVLEMLQRVWKGAPNSLGTTAEQDRSLFLDRFRFLSTTVITAVGPIAFSDKLLSKTAQETFQTSSTPTSHRQSQDSSTSRSPLLHLLQLISEPSHSSLGAADDRLIRGIVEVSLSNRTSRSARLEMLCHLAESLDESSVQPSDDKNDCAQLTWKVISELTKVCLDTTVQGRPLMRDGVAASHDHNKSKRILELGIKYPKLTAEWAGLLESVLTTTQVDADHSPNSVIEDLALLVCPPASTTSVPHFIALLDRVAVPNDTEESPKPMITRPKIPGSGHRQEDHNPLEQLTGFMASVLRDTYDRFPLIRVGDVSCLFEGIARFIERYPSVSRSTVLENCQTGLAVWIADLDDKLTKRNVQDKTAFDTIQSLISQVVRILETCDNHDSALLEKLAVVISSGLESHHKPTVNHFIRMWNATFGQQPSLDYPASIEEALRRLQPFTDLQLPSFPAGNDSKVDRSPPNFLDSQEDGFAAASPQAIVPRYETLKHTSPATPSPSKLHVRSGDDRSSKKSTPARPDVSTPQNRPRHDDSQIRFVAVDSSASGPPESQALTEHQRDVRERQRSESTHLFSGLPSSEKILQRSNSPRRTTSSSKSRCKAPGTPPLPVTANDDDVPLSSPTPGSKEQSVQLDDEPSFTTLIDWNASSDIDPPSSPPQQCARPRSVAPEGNSTPKSNRKDPKEAGPEEGLSYKWPSGGNSQLQTPPSRSKRKHKQNDVGEEPDAPLSSSKRLKTTPPSNRENKTGGQSNRSAADISKEAPRSSRKERQALRNSQDRVDLIPDSFSDELEQQITSQLEQDLELSLEDEIPLTRSTRLQKRKREESAPTPAQASASSARGRSRKKPATSTPVPANKPDAPIEDTGPFVKPDKPNAKKAGARPGTRSNPHSQEDSTGAPTSQPGDVAAPKPSRSSRRRSSRLNGEPTQESVDDNAAESAKSQGEEEQSEVHSAVDQAPEDAPGTNDAAQDVVPENPDCVSPVAEPAEPAEPPETTNIESATEAPATSTDSILSSLRDIRASIKSVSIGRTTLREIDDLMFDIKFEAHNAAREDDS